MSFVSKARYKKIFINFLYHHWQEKQVDKTRKWAANTFSMLTAHFVENVILSCYLMRSC